MNTCIRRLQKNDIDLRISTRLHRCAAWCLFLHGNGSYVLYHLYISYGNPTDSVEFCDSYGTHVLDHLAGVVEPASATPVIIEDNVMVGANAVVIEGIHVGRNAVVAAGAVVVGDVAPNTVVAGCPARVIKVKDEKTASKTALVDALRTL